MKKQKDNIWKEANDCPDVLMCAGTGKKEKEIYGSKWLNCLDTNQFW